MDVLKRNGDGVKLGPEVGSQVLRLQAKLPEGPNECRVHFVVDAEGIESQCISIRHDDSMR